jgi:hypothetical protein
MLHQKMSDEVNNGFFSLYGRRDTDILKKREGVFKTSEYIEDKWWNGDT